MQAAQLVPYLPWINGGALTLGAAGIAGWFHTASLRDQREKTQ